MNCNVLQLISRSTPGSSGAETPRRSPKIERIGGVWTLCVLCKFSLFLLPPAAVPPKVRQPTWGKVEDVCTKKMRNEIVLLLGWTSLSFLFLFPNLISSLQQAFYRTRYRMKFFSFIMKFFTSPNAKMPPHDYGPHYSSDERKNFI